MESQRIRQQFIDYFRKHQHSVIASSSVIPHDDPTLLFINAGMNQFKDVFLGKTVRDYDRAVTCQKCIRVGGKHNDLDNVGHTRRHLTFFEMLGNFSFGDYFKKEAIRFSWEVSTEIFGFDPDYLWPSVFREDDEAFELWLDYVPAERISRMDEADNFWAMGDTGPCGPCSELYYDRGPKYGSGRSPLDDPGGERFLEFWNLVFMQYNRDENGVMTPLPKPCVDTGGGLERIVSLIMDKETVFGTDILRHLIGKVEEVSGKKYDPKKSKEAPAFHVIADHLRCLAFAIADGAQPSNVDRGYVLRKVLRRAVRYGRSLGIKDPFLAKILPSLVETMGSDYRDLKESESRIAEILTLEEEAFLRTLRRGGNLLNQVMESARAHGKKISGDDAFKLKDTYGFPLEEIQLIAKDADLGIDLDRYEVLDTEARERSRAVHKTTKQEASESVFAQLVEGKSACEFVGYEATKAQGKILGLVKEGQLVDELKEGEEGQVILTQTPFYAEKGGQVGDTGRLAGPGYQFEVSDCLEPYKGVISHHGKVTQGTLKVGEGLTAIVEEERRQAIANNHTATHLLHWALQEVLGPHVKQAGSVVDAQRLRFDFSHHKALTLEETRQIEDLVNEKIRRNDPVESYELSYQDVQQRPDIKQFFGDKYDSKVRVIDIDYSKELCGGTHTSAAGTIGLFRIAKEGSIAAGVRRIEAVTGHAAEEISRQSENRLLEVAELLKTPPQKLEGRLQQLLKENQDLQAQMKAVQGAKLDQLVQKMVDEVESVNDIRLLAREVELDGKELKDFADKLMDVMGSGTLVLGSRAGEKCSLVIRVSDDLVKKGIKANDLIKALSPIIDGGGGGKANAAQAGGKAPDRLPEVLAKSKTILEA